MGKMLAAVVGIALLLGTSGAAQQKRWFELYDEAIEHIRRSEWRLAEDKLNQAKKRASPGRSVLRYGMLRTDFFPDFYLGVVYLNTNKPKEALERFRLATSQKLNAKDREFIRIGEYQQQAQQAIEASTLAENNPTQLGPRVEAGGEPEPPPPPPPVTAGSPAVDPLAAQRQQLGVRFDDAIRRKNRAEAIATLGEIRMIVTDQAAISAYAARVTALDRELRLAASERLAMRAFYSGNYTQALSALSGLEDELAQPLSARGYFYRACSLAAQALRATPVDQRALAEARRQYGEAMRAREVVAPDRRFVSPKILQALGS